MTYNTHGNIDISLHAFLRSFLHYFTYYIYYYYMWYIISAIIIFIPYLSAYYYAHYDTFTSNAIITAFSFFILFLLSIISGFIDFVIFSLYIVPIDTYDTSILLFYRNSNNASNDPSVEATTHTPFFFKLNFYFISFNYINNISIASYFYSSEFAKYILVPAIESSN